MASAFGPSFFSQPMGPTFNMDALKNLNSLSPQIQSHLQKVYMTLSAALLVAAVGACLHVLWGVGGTLSSLATFASLMWLSSTPATSANETLRLRLLMAVALFNGCSIGPLVSLAAAVNPAILPLALAATSAVFISFSAAALLARRREYLYLGAILSSALSTFLLLRLASFFFGGSALVFQAELYVGLLVFVGYTVYDTQLIVERAAAAAANAHGNTGVKDYVSDALHLLLDFLAIFVRIAIILIKNQGRKEEREREARRKSGNTSRR